MNYVEKFKGTVILKSGDRHEFSDENTYKQFVIENIDNITSTSMSTSVDTSTEPTDKDNNGQKTEALVAQKETPENIDAKALKAFRDNLNEGLISLINKAGDENVEYNSLLSLCESLGIRLETILQNHLREARRHFPADTKFIEGDPLSVIQGHVDAVSDKIKCLDEEYNKYVKEYKSKRKKLANTLSKYYTVTGFIGGIKSMTNDYVSKKPVDKSNNPVRTEVVETKPAQESKVSEVMDDAASYNEFVNWITELFEKSALPSNSAAAAGIMNLPNGYRKLFKEIFSNDK